LSCLEFLHLLVFKPLKPPESDFLHLMLWWCHPPHLAGAVRVHRAWLVGKPPSAHRLAGKAGVLAGNDLQICVCISVGNALHVLGQAVNELVVAQVLIRIFTHGACSLLWFTDAPALAGNFRRA